MPLISIKAEPIFTIGSFVVTNSLFTSFVVILLFIALAAYITRQLSLKFEKRSKIFFFIYYINRELFNFLNTILDERILTYVFAFLSSLFFYILIQNWVGLLPGIGSIILRGPRQTVPLFRGNNSDLNATLALGLFAVTMVQYFGIRVLGLFGYLGKFINLKGPIDFFVGILEIMSEFSKVLSFSFRLFGNIFAGEVLLVVIAFLVPVLASFPFLIMEVFFGFIQALIFLSLTAVFINSAVTEAH